MSLRRRFQLAAWLCLALFALTAWAVMAGATLAVDQGVLAALRVPGQPGEPSFPRWLLDLCSVISPWGAWSDRLVLALACGVALMAKGRGREAAVIMLSVAIAALVLPLAKLVFGRARPDLAFHLAEVSDLSFPSAHAMGAMILYPMAGFMLGRLVRGVRGARVGLAAGIMLGLLIGVTRVLLGVHWLSDAIGGWLLGGAWACASLALVTRGGKPRAGGVENRIAPGAAISQRRGDDEARG